MVRAYIGLGANLADPPAQLRAALARLAQQPMIRLVRQSAFYRSAPLGPPGQAEYCNAACALDAELDAEPLLDVLQAIETALGRRREGPRWGARALDLDLLLYGELELDTARLRVPHPELPRRNFVLIPLAEIAPEALVPGLGRVRDLAGRIGRAGLARWDR